jgi:hypothetical protein
LKIAFSSSISLAMIHLRCHADRALKASARMGGKGSNGIPEKTWGA